MLYARHICEHFLTNDSFVYIVIVKGTHTQAQFAAGPTFSLDVAWTQLSVFIK